MSRHPALNSLYHPITATPFIRSAAHTELPPCDALAPYVRCFWGTTEPIRHDGSFASPELVIPDTCMDIIFRLDDTCQRLSASFCAIDETSYSIAAADDGSVSSTFAIRFYAWTAALFAERPLAGSKNQAFDAADFFPTLSRALIPMLMSVPGLQERAAIASRFLLPRLDRYRVNGALMNAVHDIITTRGALRVTELAARNGISRKRLEHLFDEHMGITPKAFSSLVRYQMLWQELCFSRGCDMLDLVEKYGYFDQAHLLNDFRKHHSMTPMQAVRFARG